MIRAACRFVQGSSHDVSGTRLGVKPLAPDYLPVPVIKIFSAKWSRDKEDKEKKDKSIPLLRLQRTSPGLGAPARIPLDFEFRG
jgi:hypothetical protein